MADISELLLYVVVGGPILLIVVLLLLTGPIGWFTVVFIAIGAMVLRSLLEESPTGGSDKENCPACGSLNPPTSETCDHCGDSI
ncbi:hypothetical protein halTADL_0436 [Halohasta litchfieldiae]|jgi:hypothetical protein|uniref:Uncharacterized protein n=1 Tax=Halohasta litchfieldiae TaxID=1073996 RepID=A0A1H6W3K5_9EURY|nr:hypothetical protein [Halohasta litchfieldiae]ATW87249.1 hypothetical protein halTADL_0436 [Halohasta litchfieldiae]SEJ08637.1 hypothetical protein SAMN05444271_12029 [Halohasta litchfieldiae]